MARYLFTAVLLTAAVFLYCAGQQTYAAFMLLGWGCEMAAIAIGTRAARTSGTMTAAIRGKK